MPFTELPKGQTHTHTTDGSVCHECLGGETTLLKIDHKKEAIIHAIRALIDGHYKCGRVWEAWQIGTMTEDDFTPSEDTELPEEVYKLIAEAQKAKVEEILTIINERIEESTSLADVYEKGDDLCSGDDPNELMNDELAIIASLERLRDDISKLS